MNRPALWLSLYFYDLPLDQLRLNESLAAIVEKQRIAFASDKAQAAGIYPDMRLATAYALQPEINIIERRPDRETQALEQLAQWAYQFTPTVQVYKQFSVVLEIGGSLVLFKGLSRLLQQVNQELTQQGYRYSAGLAHTVEAAWLFSRYRADHELPLSRRTLDDISAPPPEFWLKQLRPLPLDYLDVADKQLQQLHNMGFRTLGEVIDLPRAELGRRFGRNFLEMLSAITGQQAEAIANLKPPPVFTASMDFPNGLSKIDELNAPMMELLSQLLHFLQKQQLYIQDLEWQFYYFRKPCDRLLLHTSPANNNLNSLLSLTRLKLEQLKLKEPVESLVLSSQCFAAANPISGDLFPELSHPSNQLKDYQQLLDKLLTRLGSETLSSLRMVDDHLPEHQQQSVAVTKDYIDGLRPISKPAATDSIHNPHLPLWLTPQPLPIANPNENGGPLRLVYGPQRIDSHWWRDRQQRDYYVARHQNGSYCWVFRDLKNQCWFLQGWHA